ncbi:molybdopterin molybdotransferase MoeA [Leifsonia sp. F6_8S_P_1B]|uniref:Molybdopterin molybdenumtransferase n=1 Tax=Leifsonia williamsii TaxID=3035919 RepID=A0ABT8KBI1_9MICO|nr:gephyrin-like molybdotransferase Glp [Leifsonia williamsii]MDN4614780.1 molybdopterin molybdotransferase MoeA [Leifsonia williamsii]
MTRPRSVEEHAETIERLLDPLCTEPATATVPLAEAAGRVTAEDVRSEVDLPLFRNSQMDGYAVRAADVAAAPLALEVAGDIPAGHTVPVVLHAGTAIRIMTGAPVPDGADAVVPVEDTELVLGRDDDLHGAVVEVRRPRSVGEFVRERGSDLRRGDLLVPAGTRLAARHLAALASAGVEAVGVREPLRVAVLSTGSELVASGERAGFGQVFDANGVALAALVQEAGAVVSLREACADDPEAFGRLLDRAIAVSDLVLTSGGISQGAYEVVREVVVPRGGEVTTVAMQPGGPQATALVDGVPVVCFPGNPVSTQVSFTVFVRDLLRTAAGLPPAPRRRATLAEGLRSVPGRRQFLRGRTDGDAVVAVSGPGSHLVAAMARADVLIDVPAEVEALAAGQEVTVWAL